MRATRSAHANEVKMLLDVQTAKRNNVHIPRQMFFAFWCAF